VITTTLRKLRGHGLPDHMQACKSRYEHLLSKLGADYGDDTPLPLLTILDHNGLDDSLWALRHCDCERFARLLTCDYAEHVLPLYESRYPEDNRPRRAIEVARLYADGLATADELAAARDAADAARDAAEAAWAAADAARDAGAAASAAAWDAARAAARAAAWDAARAERAWQEARLRELLEAHDAD
jgi:hypothetical protein